MRNSNQQGRKTFSTEAKLALLAAALCLVSLSSFAQRANSKPAALPAGSKLAAAWWQWVFSMPVDASPQFDTADCSAGQSGPVWFLASTFYGGSIARSCSIPAGKTLVFPVVNAWADNTGCPTNTDYTIHELQGLAAGFEDQVTNLSCTIDGVPVPKLANTPPYRVTSVFSYELPNDPDNILSAFGLACYASGGTVFPAVSDGVFVSVPPLPTGSHTIQVSASSSGGFWLDITYNITVQ